MYILMISSVWKCYFRSLSLTSRQANVSIWHNFVCAEYIFLQFAIILGSCMLKYIAYILLRQRVGKSIFSSAIGSAFLVHYFVELASGHFWANDFERKQIKRTVKTGLKYFTVSYWFIFLFSKTNIPRIQIYFYWSLSHVKRRYLFGRFIAY